MFNKYSSLLDTFHGLWGQINVHGLTTEERGERLCRPMDCNLEIQKMGNFAKLFQSIESPSVDNQVDTDFCVFFKLQSSVELSMLPRNTLNICSTHPFIQRQLEHLHMSESMHGAPPIGTGASPQSQCGQQLSIATECGSERKVRCGLSLFKIMPLAFGAA